MLNAGREQDWKKTLCDLSGNISARLTGESMVDNTSIATKSALVSAQALFLGG